jgi:flagellar hook-length control protein FliK
LAIAAAAIAASLSASADVPAASPAPTGTPVVPAPATDKAKIDAQAAAGQAVAATVNPKGAQTAATAATDVALAAAVAVMAPVAPKAMALPKASGVAPETTAALDGTDTVPTTADSTTATSTGIPATGAAPQPAVAGKPKTANGIVDAAKTDGSANASPAPAANVSANANSAVAEAGPALANSPDTAPQTTGTLQPQLHSAAAVAATAAAPSPTVTVATNAAVPLSGLALEIAISARSGNSRFEIRLDPAELGRIDVRIDVDRNGQVTSHLMVEKPDTLSLLRQDASQLQRALDEAGFSTGDGGLQFSLRDQSSSGQNDNDGSGGNARRLIVGEEDAIPAVVAGRTYGRMLGSSSGVDIRV